MIGRSLSSLVLLAAVVLLAVAPQRAAAEPLLDGTVPVPGASGLLAVTEDTLSVALFEVLRHGACEPATLWTRAPSGWKGYLAGAPEFVSAAFPQSIEAGSPLFVRCLAEIEVRVPHGDLVLAGTLTLPPLPPPYPAAVLVSGSGPQDRDEAIEGMPDYRPFRWLAEHLQTAGVAVLRYDDRGVAASTGVHLGATSADFAADAEAVFEFLREQPGIAPDRVGLMGHSEGGLIIAMVAARNEDVAFVVPIAGPGLAGNELLAVQAELILDALGLPPEVAEQELAMGALARQLTIEERWDELEQLLRDVGAQELAALPEEVRESIDFEAIIESQMVHYQTWMRFFILHDPADDWALVTVPVLALFGALDLQVPEAGNRERMEEALAAAGNDDVTVIVLPSANHLFQKAVTGSPLEYEHLPMRFVPGFLDAISEWLLARFGSGAQGES